MVISQGDNSNYTNVFSVEKLNYLMFKRFNVYNADYETDKFYPQGRKKDAGADTKDRGSWKPTLKAQSDAVASDSSLFES